ncbi:MAG: hypothetical protein GX802_05615, partial [Clostridiales bacterium]|nr:hypothetical protein [Clostridiales bacterium]
ITVPVLKSEGGKFIPRIYVNNGIVAPVYQGENLGRLEVYCNDRFVASCNLSSSQDVFVPSIGYYLNRILNFWC